MSFLNVYDALYNQVKAFADLSYIMQSQFLIGFQENHPYQEYSVIFEPGQEGEDPGTEDSENENEETYSINIFIRLLLTGLGMAGTIRGGIQSGVSKKGILEVVEDVKAAIRSDWNLGYTRNANSVSTENAGTSFNLNSSNRYLTILINGRTPSGYNAIDCGTITLTGTQVATNIQTALQALGVYKGDGYKGAICTFDDSTKKFTIEAGTNSPRSTVLVSAGTTNDCSVLLGFDNPIEVTGRKIIKIRFGTVADDTTEYPVRYRIIPVQVTEVIYIG